MNIFSLPISLGSKEFRSFIASCVLPVGSYFIVNILILQMVFPQQYSAIVSQLANNFWAFLSILILGLGFTLYTIVNWTLRIYEGYYLPSRLKKILVGLFFRPAHRIKTKHITKVQQAQRESPEDWQEIVGKHYNQAWVDYSDAELSSPIREEDLLPSKLGNVLRAAEQYPYKYGITAGIGLWTRLAVLLPSEISNALEENNNNLLFLLNSSLLSYLSGFIFIGFGSYSIIANGLLSKSQNESLIIGIIWLALGYLLYLLSIPVAKTLGLLIRSSFDLYRFDLLKQLNLPIPRTLSEEQRIWLKLSDFIVTGGALGNKPLEFAYNVHVDSQVVNMETKKGDDTKKSYKESIAPKQRPSHGASMFSNLISTGDFLTRVGVALSKIIQAKSSDVKEIAASQIELLSSYYELVLSQARASFRWALFWAGIGVLSFLYSGWLLLANGEQSIALLGGIGGAIVEVIAGINFYLYSKSAAQLAEFHTRLDTTQRHLLANSISEGLVGNWKEDTRARLALAVAGYDGKFDSEQKEVGPNVQIVHIENNPKGNDVSREYVKIGNFDSEAIDLSGWTLRDHVGHSFSFSKSQLLPGQYIKIWTKTGKNKALNFYWNRKQAVWNNTGDHAYLLDSTKKLIHEYEVVHGEAQIKEVTRKKKKLRNKK